jgi:hypothetical protein
MKMKVTWITAVMLAALSVIAGCVSQAPVESDTVVVSDPVAPADSVPAASGDSSAVATSEPADAEKAAESDAVSAVSGATVSEAGSGWSIALKGIRQDTLWQSDYEAARSHASHYVKKTADKKGVATEYRGLPLRMAIAMIDGNDAEHAYLFDQELWAAGYDITLIASDGYSATFSTSEVAPDALIIADQENGKSIPAMIVGDTVKTLWVKNLVSIETSLSPNLVAKAAADFYLDLDINGATASFSLAELEKMDYYMEARGAYTTSAGTKYEGVYGGVRLLDLLNAYTTIGPEDAITFVAMDGYEMGYPGSRVLDNRDGDWILAFKLDGEYLPKDPGYIRTIKVGPDTPNIEGHLSVRMVKKIVIKQDEYVEFDLVLDGKLARTLDRGTVQSCVSCHTTTVTFEQKGVTSEYTGFPLWMLMGYVDDPQYGPHQQDKSILAYDETAARSGYSIQIMASDGFSVTLDSREVNKNSDIIIAMYKNGEKLPDNEAPLVLAWDKDAALVPKGAKNVKMISSVKAIF